jgi:hypothetical protein
VTAVAPAELTIDRVRLVVSNVIWSPGTESSAQIAQNAGYALSSRVNFGAANARYALSTEEVVLAVREAEPSGSRCSQFLKSLRKLAVWVEYRLEGGWPEIAYA